MSNSDDGTCIDRKSSACDCYLSLATLLPPSAVLMQRDAESHRCKTTFIFHSVDGEMAKLHCTYRN